MQGDRGRRDDPPIQCPVLEELAPAADFGLGDRRPPTTRASRPERASRGLPPELGEMLRARRHASGHGSLQFVIELKYPSSGNSHRVHGAFVRHWHRRRLLHLQRLCRASCCSHAVRDGYPDKGMILCVSTTASINSRRIREARGWWIATTSAEILNPAAASPRLPPAWCVLYAVNLGVIGNNVSHHYRPRPACARTTRRRRSRSA